MTELNRRNTTILLLILWSITPLIWQLYTSFCSPEALISPFENIAKRWTLDNYRQVFQADPPFWRYLVNSSLVGIYTTFITLLISIPAAYSLVKLPRRIANVSKLVLTSVALFPYVLLFLALLEFARSLNLGNNLLALSIPYSGLSLPLAILLISSAIKDLPADLEEAAKIDGLNLWQRFRWILVPLIAPACASTAIIVFLFSWNEYPIALTWISKDELLTLPVAIARLAGSSVYSVPYGAYAAATVIGSIPLIIIMIIFQKQIVSGLTQGAVKG